MRSIFSMICLTTLLLGVAGPAEAGWEEGVAAFKSGNFNQAATEFQGVVEQQPDWPGGHYMLGQTLLKLNRKTEALTHLKKAYDLKPSDIQYQLALANLYVGMRRFQEAAGLLGQVNEGSVPKNQLPWFYESLAASLEKTGQSTKALGILEKWARVAPNDPEAQFRYGTAVFNSGQTSAAAASLEKAVRLDPKDPEKKKVLAQVLIRSGRESSGSAKVTAYRKATETAKALAAEQPNYDNLLLLGEAQLGASDYDGAVISFEQAAKNKNGDWLAQFYIGQAQTARQQYGAAEAALKKALASTSSAADQRRIHKQLGFVYEKLKKFDDAVEAYQRAGDPAGAQRVAENKRISEENLRIEEENKRIEELKRKEEELKKALEALPGGSTPPPPPGN